MEEDYSEGMYAVVDQLVKYRKALEAPHPSGRLLVGVAVLGRMPCDRQGGLAARDLRHLVIAIRPPTVREGTARHRLTFSAAHEERDVDALADAVRRHVAV
jgi:hypothetical protein